MGVDMLALDPPSGEPHAMWRFSLNWSGMAKMAEEMDRAGVLDVKTSHDPWPKWPGEEHFRELDDMSPFGEWWEPIDPIGAAHADATIRLRFSLGEDGKVPAYKFESNDYWAVTIPECRWIAEALETRALLLDEGRWRDVVVRFAEFNRLCGEKTSGYVVA